MIKVVLLGFGNINSHLIKAFHKSKAVSVVQVFNRSSIVLDSTFSHTPVTNKIEDIEDADVYIIGISDDAIASFSESLQFENKLVVHTSGGVSMDLLANKNRRGVFYPLQTFSKQKQVDFSNIPICIEAENPNDLKLLQSLGEIISETVEEIPSEKRAKLHLAAVFVNNFVNYLYIIGEDILSKENISFNLLKPLIKETAAKIEDLNPEAAQTGPAKRNDTKTIEKHLSLIENDSHKEVYKMITEQLKKHWK